MYGCEYMYRIARGRKLSRILRFVAIRESFLHEILGRGIIWSGKSKQSMKGFSAKIVFFINCESFRLYGRDNVAVVIVVNTNQIVKMGKAWGWAKGRAGAIIANL